MAGKRLTPKQAAFVREYLVDLNATAAAVRAGYPARSAKQRAYELLQRPHVAQAVQLALEERAERVEDTADAVLRDLLDLYRKCVSEGDFRAAVKAIELRGKHLGIWKERVEPLKVQLAGALEVKSADEAWQKILRDPRAAVLLDELAQRLEAGGPLEG